MLEVGMSPAVKRVSESGTIQACSSRFRSLLHSPCLSHSCHNGYREQGGFCVKRTTLRSVALRAPYMHNASIAALAEPVRHYETGGIDPQVVRHAASNPANRPRATRPSCVYGNIEW